MRGAVIRCAVMVAAALTLSACALTSPATNVTSASAIFHARGWSDGSAAHLYFEYSTDAADIGTASALRTPTLDFPALPAGTAQAIDAPVTGLEPDTRYYYDVCGADAQVHSATGGDICEGTQFSLVTLPATALPLTVDGPMATGTISNPGHFATFSFTGTAGQVVAPLYELNTFSGAPLTTSIQDASGNHLAATSEGTYTLPADGTYTVVADGNGATGTFTLGVYDAAPITAIENGPTVNLPIIAGQQTVVSFTGTAGEHVNAQVSNPLTNVYFGGFPTGTLEDASGNKIAGPNNLVGSSVSGILPTTGTYKLVVDSNNTTTLLALTLTSIQDVHGSITVNGPPVTASISISGQRNYFAFDGTAGEVVGLTFGPTTYGDMPPDLVEIQDASGTPIPGTDYNYTLPSTGTYNVVIGTSPVSASLRLSSPPVHTPPGTIVANGPIVNLTAPTPTTNVSVTFTGTAGEQVTVGTALVSISQIGPGGQATTSIKDASGAVLPVGARTSQARSGRSRFPGTARTRSRSTPNNEGAGTAAIHLTTPEPGAAAAVRSAGRAQAATTTPIQPTACGKLSWAQRGTRHMYYSGRDAWCVAPRRTRRAESITSAAADRAQVR